MIARGEPWRFSAFGGAPGTTFTTWIEELHEAGVWRRPMQAFLSVTGVSVALFSFTGVLVRARTRSAGA